VINGRNGSNIAGNEFQLNDLTTVGIISSGLAVLAFIWGRNWGSIYMTNRIR